MKVLAIVFLFTIITACSKKNGNTHNSNQDTNMFKQNVIVKSLEHDKKVEIYSIGIGSDRDQALLSATGFLAEQIAGVKFSIKDGKLTLKTPATLISGALPLYYREINDGRILCIMKYKRLISAKSLNGKYIEKNVTVTLNKIINQRTELYESIFKSILSENTNKTISGFIIIREISKIPEKLNLKNKIDIKFNIYF